MTANADNAYGPVPATEPLALKSNEGLGVLATERTDDAISRSKRILEMVDIYCARPDSMNRTALRVTLMGEFEDARAQGRDDFGPADMHILRAALADYAENKKVLEARRCRARLMWQVLRAA